LSTSAIQIFKENIQIFESKPLASESILLAVPPKGYEGFLSKDDKQSSKKSSEFKFSDFGSGGGSDKKKYNFQRNKIYKIHIFKLFFYYRNKIIEIAVIIIETFIIYFIFCRFNNFRKITGNDFSENYFSKGNIAHLEIIDNKWVKIVLKTPEQVK
jgi:hypothetical protein